MAKSTRVQDDIIAVLPALPFPRLLLRVVAAMTEQRSLVALEREFMASWPRIMPHHLVSLLNIDRDPAERLALGFRQELGSFEALKVLVGEMHIAAIERAIRTTSVDHIYMTDDGGNRMVVLPSNSRECQVVMFLGRCFTQDEEEAVNLLTSIYCNCKALLNDNLRDMLTGMLNRRSFEERVSEISSLLRRPKSGDQQLHVGDFAAAVMDIDHFKRVNDTYGHIVGDETLITFASIMRASFRASDLLFRFGGEEFVVILTHTKAERVMDALNRFRINIENHVFPQVGQVTVSIGYVLVEGGLLPTELIDRADQALYYAKSHGRNQVCCYEKLVEQGLLAGSAASGEVELFWPNTLVKSS